VNKAKQFLLLIMSIACVAEIVGMQEKVIRNKLLLDKSSTEVARSISDDCPISILLIAAWLNEHRKDIKDNEWGLFVDKFLYDIDICIPNTGPEREKLSETRDIIKDVASNLQPYHDCSRELLNRVRAEKIKAKL
jgi:hypothetical protein